MACTGCAYTYIHNDFDVIYINNSTWSIIHYVALLLIVAANSVCVYCFPTDYYGGDGQTRWSEVLVTTEAAVGVDVAADADVDIPVTMAFLLPTPPAPLLLRSACTVPVP